LNVRTKSYKQIHIYISHIKIKSSISGQKICKNAMKQK